MNIYRVRLLLGCPQALCVSGGILSPPLYNVQKQNLFFTTFLLVRVVRESGFKRSVVPVELTGPRRGGLD